MKREPSLRRTKVVLFVIVLIWLIIAILFGFVLNKPTSLVGLSVIVIFLIFIVALLLQFLYGRSKNQ